MLLGDDSWRWSSRRTSTPIRAGSWSIRMRPRVPLRGRRGQTSREQQHRCSRRPSAEQWHYYAFVINTEATGEKEITPYVDGRAVSYTKLNSETGAGNFADSTLYWMSRDASALFGQGSMQDLALYDTTLARPRSPNTTRSASADRRRRSRPRRSTLRWGCPCVSTRRLLPTAGRSPTTRGISTAAKLLHGWGRSADDHAHLHFARHLYRRSARERQSRRDRRRSAARSPLAPRSGSTNRRSRTPTALALLADGRILGLGAGGRLRWRERLALEWRNAWGTRGARGKCINVGVVRRLHGGRAGGSQPLRNEQLTSSSG